MERDRRSGLIYYVNLGRGFRPFNVKENEMKLKVYTDDDVLAGEIKVPQGAVLISNHQEFTKQVATVMVAAGRHERGDPPEPRSNGGQSVKPVDVLAEWPGNRYRLIRPEIVAAINRYALQHQPVGDFLTAVLTNDLKGAFGRADENNRENLHEIVGYVYNEIPSVCQGSAAKYKAWTEMDQAEWPDSIMAPETTKELARQDAAGIWGFTKFKEGK